MEKETILVSACLLGVHCRYDGNGKAVPELERLTARYALVPVCPEQLGGLATPRDPAERKDGGVFSKRGADVTAAYARGATETLALARRLRCNVAILKERSPSCGHGTVYDGTFTGRLVPGDGVTAALLAANGIAVYGESDIEALLKEETV